MAHLKLIFALLATATLAAAKPSHPFALHSAIPDHFDFAPPVLPAPHFHAAAPAFEPAPLLPAPHLHAFGPGPLLPAPAPVPAPLLPAPHLHFSAPGPVFPAHQQLIPAPAPLLPAPAPLLPAPAPLLPAPAPLLPAPAPLFPAPAHLLPAPVVHTQFVQTPVPVPVPVAVPAPVPIPPVLEPAPFIAHAPTYRAIPGPKTTTHHISVGYAFPAAAPVTKIVSPFTKFVAPHAHLHAAPLLSHHHHHSLF